MLDNKFYEDAIFNKLSESLGLKLNIVKYKASIHYGYKQARFIGEIDPEEFMDIVEKHYMENHYL